MRKQRRRFRFRGRVQGVGFRFTTCRIASAYPVDGSVRNLPDGGVELVVEGGPEDVEAFLDAVKDAFEDHIDRVEAEEVPEDEPIPGGFEIRY